MEFGLNERVHARIHPRHLAVALVLHKAEAEPVLDPSLQSPRYSACAVLYVREGVREGKSRTEQDRAKGSSESSGKIDIFSTPYSPIPLDGTQRDLV